MKKIGIVGGVGWQSTTEYYSELCRRTEEFHLASNPHDVPTMPEISIESLDLAKAISYLGSDDDEQSWSQFADYHRRARNSVFTAAAGVLVLVSITAAQTACRSATAAAEPT
jgi:aspartate racemase